METKNIIVIGVIVVVLVSIVAGAGVLIMGQMADDNSANVSSTHNRSSGSTRISQAQHSSLPLCNDDNILGKIIGGAAGGIAGSQLGGGKGKTATTIGGAVGGSLLGEEYIPTQNATCR